NSAPAVRRFRALTAREKARAPPAILRRREQVRAEAAPLTGASPSWASADRRRRRLPEWQAASPDERGPWVVPAPSRTSSRRRHAKPRSLLAAWRAGG